MYQTTLERLNRLQMDDLGTARREYISTTDNKKLINARLEDIEATRMSNVAGSEAQRMAKANESRINEWTNVYKKISDTDDLEDLDNLLNGQSHRLHLRAIVQGSGGQSYSKSAKKNDNLLAVAEKPASTHAPFVGGTGSGGRGGGVIGTRGRNAKQTSPNTQARISNQEAISKLGLQAAQALQAPQASQPRKRPQDPALDINNYPSKKSFEEIVQKNQVDFKAYRKKPEPAFLKTRRPLPYVTRILSPPEDFLAVAHSVQINRASDVTSVANKFSENKTGIHQIKTQDILRESQKTTIVAAENSPSLPYEDSVTSSSSFPREVIVRLPGPAISTPTSSLSGQSMAQEVSSQVPLLTTEQDNQSEPMSLESSEQGRNASETGDDQTPPESNDLAIDLSEAESGEIGEILVDCSSTPPPEPIDNLRSPAMEDLKGIVIRHNFEDTQDTALSPCSFVMQRTRINLQRGLNLKKGEMLDGEEIHRIQEAISFLTNFVETTSLCGVPDEYLQKLTDSIKACEEKLGQAHQICKAKDTHQETTTQPPQETISLVKLSNNESGQPREAGKESETETPEPPKLSFAEATPIKQDKRLSGIRLEDSPSPQSLFNASAPAFVPRSSSFSKYRSPNHSISSDSTYSIAASHSGQHSEEQSKEKPKEQPKTSRQYQGHLYGDHLLPGRRRLQESAPGIDASAIEHPRKSSQPRVKFSVQPARGSVLSDVKLPAFEGFGESSLPDFSVVPLSQYPEKGPSTSITSSKSIPVVGTSKEASSIPAPAKRRLASITVAAKAIQKTDPNANALQESIHAPPKAQENHSPTPKPRGSVQKGLENSIYATQETYKPLRWRDYLQN